MGVAPYPKARELREIEVEFGIEPIVAINHFVLDTKKEIQTIINFCKNFEEILVIEEKASIVEEQVAHILFNSKSRPLLSGKLDASSKEELVPKISELSSDIIADCLLKKAVHFHVEKRLS